MDSIKTTVAKEVLNAVSENTGFRAKKKAISKKMAGKCAFAYGAIALFLFVFSCTVNEENSYDNGINGPKNGNFTQTTPSMAFNITARDGKTVRNGTLEHKGGEWRILMEWLNEYEGFTADDFNISSIGGLPTAFASAIKEASPTAKVPVALTILDPQKYDQSTSITYVNNQSEINPTLKGLDVTIANALLDKFHKAIEEAADASSYEVTGANIDDNMNLYMNADNNIGNTFEIPLTTDGMKVVLNNANGTATIEWTAEFRGRAPRSAGQGPKVGILDAWNSDLVKSYDEFINKFGGGKDSIEIQIKPKDGLLNNAFIHSGSFSDVSQLTVWVNVPHVGRPANFKPFKININNMIDVKQAGYYPDLPDTLKMSDIATFNEQTGKWVAKAGAFTDDLDTASKLDNLINGHAIQRRISNQNILDGKFNTSDLIVTKMTADAILRQGEGLFYSDRYAFVNGLHSGQPTNNTNNVPRETFNLQDVIFKVDTPDMTYTPNDLAAFVGMKNGAHQTVGLKGNILIQDMVNNTENTYLINVGNASSLTVMEIDGDTISNRRIISRVQNAAPAIHGDALTSKIIFDDFSRFHGLSVPTPSANLRDSIVRVQSSGVNFTVDAFGVPTFTSLGFHFGGIGMDGKPAYVDLKNVGNLGKHEPIRAMSYAFGRDNGVQYQNMLETGNGTATTIKNWIDNLVKQDQQTINKGNLSNVATFDGADWYSSINPATESGRPNLVRGLVDGTDGMPFVPLQLARLTNMSIYNAILLNGIAKMNDTADIGRIMNVRIDIDFGDNSYIDVQGGAGLIYLKNTPRHLTTGRQHNTYPQTPYTVIENINLSVSPETIGVMAGALDITQITSSTDKSKLPLAYTVIYDTAVNLINPGTFFDGTQSHWKGTETNRTIGVNRGEKSYFGSANSWADVLGTNPLIDGPRESNGPSPRTVDFKRNIPGPVRLRGNPNGPISSLTTQNGQQFAAMSPEGRREYAAMRAGQRDNSRLAAIVRAKLLLGKTRSA